MNPNISVEKASGETNHFTITQIGAGAYLMPSPGSLFVYGDKQYVVDTAQRQEVKTPTWVVTATLYGNAPNTPSGNYTQVITPSPDIPCTPGLCLVYVRETFGIGPKYPTATAGWQASNFKHVDQDFPNAWVPVWFSLSDEPAGHVALRQSDGSIWSASHPTAKQPIRHSSLADIVEYFGGRLSYLGWTEDIEDELVVKST